MKTSDLKASHPFIFHTQKKSNKFLNSLKENDKSDFDGCIIVNGSLARLEMTTNSDFDAYPIFSNESNEESVINQFKSFSDEVTLKQPAKLGAFGEPVLKETYTNNIGGNSETNEILTRRMLLILESKCLYGDVFYEKLLCDVVERYISDKTTNHQLGMFLLNDIIRFYRTMCVDFEYKTVEDKKPWGIRNIKLIFSRKLIYFSGIVMCAELAQRSAQTKRDILLKLIQMSPIERLLYVMGRDILPALNEYELFIENLDNKRTRKILVDTKRGMKQPNEFRDLKNCGHHFTWKLSSALNKFYDRSHPIHKAILM